MLELGNLDDVVGTLLAEANSGTNSNPAGLPDPEGLLNPAAFGEPQSPATPFRTADKILSTAEALGEAGWTPVKDEAGVRVGLQRRDTRHLCAASVELKASATKGVAAICALLRNWGAPDGAVQGTRMLSEVGGMPAPGADAKNFLEQTFAVDGAGEPRREYVLGTKWSLQSGNYSCMARPSGAAGPPAPGVQRGLLSIDVWLVPHRTDENKSWLRVIVDLPPELASKVFNGEGATAICGWGRRVQEALAM